MLNLADVRADLPSLKHLRRLTAPAGVVQFCQGPVPDASSGVCLDDNARALLVAVLALAADPDYKDARAIGDAALRFVVGAQRRDGLFHNFADINGDFLDDLGSVDSIGRALWACGVTAGCATVPEWRDSALAVLRAALPIISDLWSRHARAYTILGLAAAVSPEAATPLRSAGGPIAPALRSGLLRRLEALCQGLDDEFSDHATPEWRWWSPELTWGNARLPEALLRGAAVTGSRQLARTGMQALGFLAGVTHMDDTFVPIGNDGWYVRGGSRAIYDQQPIEACAMVDAWLAAYRLSGELMHRARAVSTLEWFHGRNTERLSLAQVETGGCYDGLRRGRVNSNQGAESTLSYLHAQLMMRHAEVTNPPL